MKKNISNIIIIILLITIMYELINNSIIIRESIINSFELWKNNIFPFLFPFFIISDLLINFNIIEIINKYLNKIMYKIFKINSSSSFIFFMSILSGIPSNSKYINSLIKNNELTCYEGQKILMFTHFVSPIFILGYIGNIIGRKYSIYILYIHYITNIIIGLIFRNYHPNNLTALNNKKISNSLIKTITNSILNSINTLFLILGIISFFSFIIAIITSNINNPVLKSIICSILEITQGINSIGYLNISIKFKVVLITFIISFGGLSSHMQVMSILEDTNIKYFPYLLTRILHAIISSFLIIVLIY